MARVSSAVVTSIVKEPSAKQLSRPTKKEGNIDSHCLSEHKSSALLNQKSAGSLKMKKVMSAIKPKESPNKTMTSLEIKEMGKTLKSHANCAKSVLQLD